MKTILCALTAAALLSASSAAFAQDTPADKAPPPAPAQECSPTVSAVLGTWDAGMATAEKFGDKATALAREKGREYLLPLLGIDPKTVPPQAPGDRGADKSTDEVARELEASRNDPARRAALCGAITRAMTEARDKAGAGLDALKRALDTLELPAIPGKPATPPATPPADPNAPTQTQGTPGLIKT